MAKSCCRMYPLVAAVFLAGALFKGDSGFMLFYPALLWGMIPVTLLAYDERGGFLRYRGALPCTPDEYVFAKYLFGLIGFVTVWLLTCAVSAVRGAASGTFEAGPFLCRMAVILASAMLTPAVTLPFMFRYGVEKGRIAYYLALGLVLGGCALLTSVPRAAAALPLTGGALPPLFLLLSAVLYAGSALLSASFFRKREF